ncbi:hypothetical protein PNOK_0893200 [Pyrrhoderma noxium]|uniref:Uncharacterized protein n=1 Tax=Pyrrhoderma noxium TaxID=2282107 RepID=A0A286U6F9_9AGAM|nr:hypothetical protein PNOK_0893200 [Pyrrhoderma noxium]
MSAFSSVAFSRFTSRFRRTSTSTSTPPTPTSQYSSIIPASAIINFDDDLSLQVLSLRLKGARVVTSTLVPLEDSDFDFDTDFDFGSDTDTDTRLPTRRPQVSFGEQILQTRDALGMRPNVKVQIGI